ncbi:hypothetical protein [Saccharothrix xinjiangensis]|uniref:PKS/mFAS DH domain-containing protein n=1 Tax=Saccharothrix xinjiangensis TaxID=204798 RepID=A0ABV9Y6V3_9PSEU
MTATENAPGTRPAGFYQDRVERTATGAVVFRLLDDRDDHLRDHTVDGVPTLPGCFAAEMAAQAAGLLAPGRVVTGFRDLTFDRFVKVGATARGPLRALAELRAADEDVTVVDVRVVADVVARSGRVLAADRQHCSVRVVLADAHPRPPTWDAWPTAAELPVVDPYHVDGAPVRLDGPFRSTAGTRLHPMGARAAYTAPARPGSVFERFTTPALLLDGMLRLTGVELLDDRYAPVSVPTGVGRVDLYTGAHDVALGALGGVVDLTSSPRGVVLGAEPGGRVVATAPDGRVLAQLKDVAGLVVGYFDVREGRHLRELPAGAPGRPTAAPRAIPV